MPQSQIVELPDGAEIEFPEDFTEDQISEALSSLPRNEPQMATADVPPDIAGLPEPSIRTSFPRSNQELSQRGHDRNASFPGMVARDLSVDPQTMQNAWDVIKSGPTFANTEQLGQRDTVPGTGVQIATGLQNLGAELASSFVDPVNAAAMATGVAIPKAAFAISGAFAKHMLSQVPEQARAAGEASVSGTPFEKTKAYGGLATSAAFIPGLGAHAVRGSAPLIRSGIRAVHELTPGGKVSRAERVEAGQWLEGHMQRMAERTALENDPNLANDPAKQQQLDQIITQQEHIGLSEPHQKILDEQMKDVDLPVEVVWGDKNRKTGQFMGIKRAADGTPESIQVHGEVFPQWLESVAKNRRAAATGAGLREEAIHQYTTSADADAAVESLTPIEQKLYEKMYGRKVGEQGFSKRDLGYEVIRMRLERAGKQSPREFIEASFEDRLDMHALEAMANAARKLRERFGTRASQEGRAALDRTEANIEAAKAARRATGQPEAGATPPDKAAPVPVEAESAAPGEVTPDAADLALEELGVEPATVENVTPPDNMAEAAYLQERVDAGPASQHERDIKQHREDTARLEEIKASAVDQWMEDNPAAVQKDLFSDPDKKKILTDSLWAKMRAAAGGDQKITRKAEAQIKEQALRGKELPGDNPAAIKRNTDWRKASEVDPSRWGEAIKQSGFRGLTEWAYDAGKSAKASDIPSMQEARTKAAKESMALLMAGKDSDMGTKAQFFGEAIRFRQALDAAKEAGTLDDTVLSVLESEHGVGDNTGRELKAALEEELLADNPAAISKTQIEKVARETIIGLEQDAAKYRAAGKHGDADELEGYADTLKKNFPAWEEQSFPAATFKQKQADKLADLRRAAAEGREAPGLKAPSGQPAYASVAKEERVGPGTTSNLTPADLERSASKHLAGEIKVRPLTKERSAEAQKGPPRVSYDRPTFDEFSKWAERNMEGVKPAQLRDLWEDKVWSEVLKASPERLEDWRRALGLEKAYGKQELKAEIDTRERFEVQLGLLPQYSEIKKVSAPDKEAKSVSVARNKYRNKLVTAIVKSLVRESIRERPDLSRTEITTDDIDFGNTKTQAGPYRELGRDEISDPQVLNRILRDQARASSADPESATRRLVAVVDNSGHVDLLSTYQDAGTTREEKYGPGGERKVIEHEGIQRVTDPTGPKVRGRPNRELNSGFLRQYRPFASVLLSDPVQGFHQRFESVSEFMDKIGKEAIDRSKVGEFPGEGPAVNFSAEGSEGLEGEGGSVMGPEAGVARAAMGMGRGAVEAGEHVPMTGPEAASIIDHVIREVGRIESTSDIDAAISALKDEANPVVLSGYRKLIRAVQDQNPDMDVEQLRNKLSDQIYENYKTSETGDQFIARTLTQAGTEPAGEAPAPEASKTSQELTTPGRRLPIPGAGGLYSKSVVGQAHKLAQAQAQRAGEAGRAAKLRPFAAKYVRERPWNPANPEIRGDNPAAISKKAIIDKARELIATPIVPAPEAVLTDTTSPIPRFIPNVSTQLTRAMGVERIPFIGRSWGPRARIRDAADQDTLGYSVKRVIGRSQSNLVGNKLSGLVNKLGQPFKQDASGRVVNVPGSDMYPSDLFEEWQKNPDSVALNPKQKAQFEAMHTVLEDGYKYLDEKNAKLEEQDGEKKGHQLELLKEKKIYALPRLSLHKRDTGPIRSELQRRIGGRYAVERERLYDTEERGQKTTVYEPDMVKRVVAFVDRVYKSVADADLANSQSLKGYTPAERVPILARRHEAELRSGEMSQQDILDLSHHPYMGEEARVEGHPAFAGKIYPIEIANKLSKTFGHQSSMLMASAMEMSKLSKALMLTGDAQQYFTQGAPMMLRRPGAWKNATVGSLRSVMDPAVMSRFLQNPQHYESATQLAQLGVHLGHNQEFMAGTNPGEIAAHIPGVRQMVIRSGRAFGTFFDMSKILIWEAMRDTTPKEQWPAVARTIENITLSGGHESVGLHPARAAAEQVMVMASAYYRSAFQLAATMAEKGVAGKEAQKILGTYLGGMVVGMTGLYLMAGMGWDEIGKRLTPGLKNQKFLSFPVKMGDKTMELGFGGIVLNLAGLITDVGITMVKEPGKMVSYGMDNPIIYWLTTKMGPVPGAIREAATGEDMFERPSSPAKAVARLVQPISLQQAEQAAMQEHKVPAAIQGAASFIGIKSSRSSPAFDMKDQAMKFMKAQGLTRETGYRQALVDEASYGKLRNAVAAGSQRDFNRVYKKLLVNRKPDDIEKAMENWSKRGFTGSNKDNENEFKNSLNRRDYELYQKALEDKQDLYQKFRDFQMGTR